MGRVRVGVLSTLRDHHQTARTAAFNLARLIVGAINSLLLAVWMGPDGRGLLAAALLLPSLLVAIGGLGLAPAFLYFSASERDRRSQLASTAIYFTVAQSVVLCPIGYALVQMIFSSRGVELTVPATIYLLSIPASALGIYFAQMLLGAGEVTIYNRIGLIIPVGYLLSSLVLFSLDHLSVMALVLSQIVLNVLVSGVCVLFLKRRGVRLLRYSPRAVYPLFARVGKYALKAQLRDASMAINYRLDQLVIAALLPASQLAYYTVAASVSAVLGVLPFALQIVNMPSIAGEPDRAKQEVLVRATIRTLARTAPFVWVGAVIVIPAGTWLILGSQWLPTLWPEVLLITAGVVMGFKDILSASAAACGDPWLGSKGEIAGVLITAFGLAALVPVIGIVGAALTSLLSYAVAAGVMARGFRTRLGMRVISAGG